MGNISKININGILYDIRSKIVNIPTGTVTGGVSSAKEATVSNVTALDEGTVIIVKNNNEASSGNCTLNVNNLGGKPIYYSQNYETNAPIGSLWQPNMTLTMVYTTLDDASGRWNVLEINTSAVTIKRW